MSEFLKQDLVIEDFDKPLKTARLSRLQQLPFSSKNRNRRRILLLTLYTTAWLTCMATPETESWSLLKQIALDVTYYLGGPKHLSIFGNFVDNEHFNDGALVQLLPKRSTAMA